jgi:hypothetical protein
MTEQEAVLFLNEDNRKWELVTTDDSNPLMAWKTEADALRDLAKDGWKIDGPFGMRPKKKDLPQIYFTGYGLRRPIQ